MTKHEREELTNLQMLIIAALDCLTAHPPRRGAADYLLSARADLAEILNGKASKTDGND